MKRILGTLIFITIFIIIYSVHSAALIDLFTTFILYDGVKAV